MSRANAFTAAADEHRRAVETCASAIRSVAEKDWETPPAPTKWSPAQIAEHLAIAYDPVLSEIEGRGGFRPRFPWWQRRILRWIFLRPVLAGRFPKGVRAPREVQPTTTSPSPEEGARRLTERAVVFLDRFTEAHAQGRARVTHPYMGRLEGVVAVRFLTVHVRHHHRQLPGISSRHDPETEGK